MNRRSNRPHILLAGIFLGASSMGLVHANDLSSELQAFLPTAISDSVPAATQSAALGASSEHQRTLACFQAAERKFMIPMELLLGIAEQESSFNPAAVGSNTNGSRDYGLMQINSTWIPTLARYGVDSKSLFDPCVSIDVGAWILHDNIVRFGKNWRALGKYNAAKDVLKGHTYATSVYGRAKRIEQQVGRDPEKLLALISGKRRSTNRAAQNSPDASTIRVAAYVRAETWQVQKSD